MVSEWNDGTSGFRVESQASTPRPHAHWRDHDLDPVLLNQLPSPLRVTRLGASGREHRSPRPHAPGRAPGKHACFAHTSCQRKTREPANRLVCLPNVEPAYGPRVDRRSGLLSPE